jgi:hypothetical protein
MALYCARALRTLVLHITDQKFGLQAPACDSGAERVEGALAIPAQLGAGAVGTAETRGVISVELLALVAPPGGLRTSDRLPRCYWGLNALLSRDFAGRRGTKLAQLDGLESEPWQAGYGSFTAVIATTASSKRGARNCR